MDRGAKKSAAKATDKGAKKSAAKATDKGAKESAAKATDKGAKESAAKATEKETSLAKFGSERGSRLISYHRLAEDMLEHLYRAFRVRPRHIPRARCENNRYINRHFVSCIVRQTKLDQIIYRRSFYLLFMNNDKAMRCVNNVTKLKDFVFKCMESIAEDFPTTDRSRIAPELFNISLACVAELSLFYVSKDHPKALKKMAGVWLSYFESSISENLKAGGEVIRMMRHAIQAAYMEPFLTKFIPDHCSVYSGDDLNEVFQECLAESTRVGLCNNEEAERVKKLKSEMYASFRIQPDPVPEAEVVDENKPLLKHERLGIVPHEEILKRELRDRRPEDEGAVAKGDRDDAAIAALALSKERKQAKKAAMARGGDSAVRPRPPRTDAPIATLEADLARLNLGRRPDGDPELERRTTQPDYSALGARPKTRKQ